MKAVLLHEATVRSLLDVDAAIEAVEAVHREHGLGEVVDMPRQRTRTAQSTLHSLQAAVPSLGLIGSKLYTSNRAGARFWVHLFDLATGLPVAILGADTLGMVRTGAAGAVAAKYLSRPDARTVGVIGAGFQAQSQIEALCRVRAIEHVRVFARRREPLEAFCASMRTRTGIEVVPADSAEAAVRDMDIVVTITTSATPVLEGAWLSAGTHITAAGSNSLVRRELDEKALGRCARIVVDSRAVARQECGDILPLLEKGRLHEAQLVELGEVIAGLRPGRQETKDITVFESHGMGMQDIALAARVLEAARARGLGQELDL
ncbi:MAG: Alanine dehydrogenase [Rhodocyclaceae bacterium]|nr:Alanine dehydrogenase [Rhodocyclaceae bacterium]